MLLQVCHEFKLLLSDLLMRSLGSPIKVVVVQYQTTTTNGTPNNSSCLLGFINLPEL